MISELLLAVFSKGPDGCLGGRAVEVFDLLGERAGYWDNVRTNFLLLRTRRTQFRSQCPLRLVLCFYNVCLCLVKKKKKKKTDLQVKDGNHVAPNQSIFVLARLLWRVVVNSTLAPDWLFEYLTLRFQKPNFSN